ncbi:MAG: pyruvate kinase alpha/beta domain-containing protein [Candidatus Margulisbacteria bacterium]|nr:pyruvate kinase alpha/beta domain-containing protein [Candidatus Margulisiibacteriota bacterium]
MIDNLRNERLIMQSKIVYFEDHNPENTLKTFQLAKERLHENSIKKIVLASTTGKTAVRALEFFADSEVQLIIIPHQFDFKRTENPFPQDLIKNLRSKGHEVHFGTMLFHTDNLYGNNTSTTMASLLRCFCQGIKVCFEIVLMATDAGHLQSGEKVVAIAGTGYGADTALVMQASSSQNLKKLRVNEILCKPLNPLNSDELKEKLAQEKSGYEKLK